MKKKHIVILTLVTLLIVAIVSISHLKNRNPPVPISIETTLPILAKAATLPPDSLLLRLNNHTLFAFDFTPLAAASVLDHFNNFKTKIAATKIGNRFKLNELFDRMSISTLLYAPQFQNLPPESQEFLKLLAESSSSVRELVVSASSNTFHATADLDFPSLLLSARFTNTSSTSNLFELLQKNIRNISGMQQGLTIDANTPTGDKNYIHLVLRSAGSRTSLNGFVRQEAENLFIGIGADDVGTFIATKQEETLTASPRWADLQKGLLANPTVFIMFDYSQFAPLIERLLASSALKADEEGAAAATNFVMQAWSEYVALSASLQFDQGLAFRSCVRMDEKSPSAINYTRFVEQSHTQGSRDDFFRLISPSTIFGLRITRPMINLLLQSMKEAYSPRNRLNEKEIPADWQDFLKKMETLESAFTKIPFSEIGILMNASVAGPVPEFGVFMGSKENINLSYLAETINSLLKTISDEAASAELPLLTVSQDPDSKGEANQILELQIAEGERLTAGLVSPHVVVGSSGDTLRHQAAGVLSQSISYLESLAPGNKAAMADLTSSEIALVLNSGGALQMAKPFLPLLLMQQPELQLSLEELEETLKLLEFTLIGTQHSSIFDQQTICGDVRANVY